MLGVGQDLPARAAEEWFDAVADNDTETAMARTCVALRDSPRLLELWAGAQIGLNDLQARLADAGAAGAGQGFSTIERDGARAVVAVASADPGSNPEASASDPHDLTWTMVLEGGKWRWCGTSSVESGESTPTGQGSPLAQPSSTHTPTATYTKAPSPTPRATVSQELPWKPCPSAPESRLHVGDQAYVGYEPPLPNRVREKPNWDTGRVIGRIFPGETVEILEGPVCNNQVVWWKVQSLEKELVGWTAEGDSQDYWLMRMP